MSESEYNPFSSDTIDKMLADRAKREKAKALIDEEVVEYKRALNRLFSSRDGRFFLKKLIRYCGIYSFDKTLNPAKLIENDGKRKVYLEMIRPYLEPDVIAKLEN